MTRMHRAFAFFFWIVSAVSLSTAQSYYPKEGADALRAQALELRSNLNVLMISLRPGDEDFAALATYRLWKGASVLSLYATNGEAMESNEGLEYPPMLAARRRVEAQKAMDMMGCGVYFLNMPDLAAARDTSDVYESWNSDTLEIRLMRVISTFRPDVILLNAQGKPDILGEVLKSHVLGAVGRLAPPSSVEDLKKTAGLATWKVDRVFSRDTSGATSGKQIQHPVVKKSAEEIGNDATKEYGSLRIGTVRQRAYKSILPVRRKFRTLDQGLPHSSGFKGIEKQVNMISDRIMNDYKVLPSQRRKREELVARATTAIDSIDAVIRGPFSQSPPGDRRAIVHWKEKLQSLRNRLLGVKVHYSLSEEILTPRQVTFLRIDSISGIGKTGQTFLFFPFAKQGWIIDERYNNERVEYVPGKTYEIVSPEKVPFHYPTQVEGLEQHTLSWPMLFFVVHDAGSPTKNFIERITIPLQFAPKFSVEVLTPIVRATNGERVAIRLTNQSRDGVSDYVSIEDSTVSSVPLRFRLSTKGSVFQDTIVVNWKRTPQQGEHLLPINIEGILVGNVGARPIDLRTHNDISVALLTRFKRSVIEETVRRCGIKLRRITVSELNSISSTEVLIIDELALSDSSNVLPHRQSLESFAERGGRIIILRQTPEDWNRMPIIPGIRVTEAFEYTPTDSVVFESSHPLFAGPNAIGNSDWDGWLFARAHQNIAVTIPNVDVPLRIATNGNPLLVVARKGSGHLIYVNLALSWQWLNIHEGSFRFLANLLSY